MWELELYLTDPPEDKIKIKKRAGRPMETVHIDLAGPYEASMGGFLRLIMFVDSASRWMRPYGIKRT